ncbi:MAG: manganese efflux pump [Bacteroidaceae bacterium]|nr:manganese efflux pump [Bacteroidaceae bacterium]
MVSLLEIWLLGFALAMDCFSVSIAQGLSAKRIIWHPMTMQALSFGIFQGGMTLLGYIGTSLFSKNLQHLEFLAVLLLFYLGVKMIWEGIKDKEEETADLKTFHPLNIITLSVATSIDALAVGISFACLQSVTLPTILQASCIIGLCSTLFSIAGLGIGIKASRHINIRSEVLGGIILICIGLKILIEHLI